MSFNIGQMRRNQYSLYSEPLEYNLKLIINQNSIINFYDQCMYLSGNNIVSSIYSYYLKFEVNQRLDEIQDFVIKLKNDESIDNIQEIRALSVKQGTDKTIFELIFNPNSTYNQIVFELKRLVSDFHIEEESGKSGRIMKINILAFDKINNVITNYLVNHYPGLTSLKKIGIQGPPGLMFVIDGEEIKIGKSGIYELYNTDISISYIGFVLKNSAITQNGEDFFIMDFKY